MEKPLASRLTESQVSASATAAVRLPADPSAVRLGRTQMRLPSWRGWIHLATVPAALAAGIVLIAMAQHVHGKVGAAIYMAASLLLFGVSAVYHRGNYRGWWSPAVYSLLRRLDHANIFLLIAGTYTPMALLALDSRQATILLSIVWSGAVLGLIFRVAWVGSPRWLYVPLYVALGWAAIMYIGPLMDASVAMMVLIIVGGGLYTLGAVIYSLKWPNPWPNSFGFHEIFHACTVLAFFCHWAAILVIALQR